MMSWLVILSEERFSLLLIFSGESRADPGQQRSGAGQRKKERKRKRFALEQESRMEEAYFCPPL